MNFKTTIVLLILLAGATVAVIMTRGGGKSETADNQVDTSGRKLLDISSDRVNLLSITDAQGHVTKLIKEDAKWKMTAPAKVAAVDWTTRDLVNKLADLHSRGRPASDPGAAAGLDKPRYRIELGTDDGKSVKISLGSKAGPDDMYAQVQGGSEVDLVDASLDKTLKTAATDLRDKHLVTVTPAQIKQASLTYKGNRLELQQAGGKWVIIAPERMMGDSAEITSFLESITGLEAKDFLSSDDPQLAIDPFRFPTMKMWLSTQGPSTQPAATTPSQAGGTTITIGLPTDILNSTYFVRTSDGLTGTIEKTAWETLNKKPLDLRDRDVVSIEPAEVKRIAIVKETFAPPATQPSTQATTEAATQPQAVAMTPISHKVIVLVKRKIQKELGPVLPATMPTTVAAATGPSSQATTMAATQPGTMPTETASTWQLEGDDKTQIDDAKVTDLLAKFDPLHVDKYDESAKSGVLTRYTVDISSGAAEVAAKHLEFASTTDTLASQGLYDGSYFEVPKTTADALDAQFVKK